MRPAMTWTCCVWPEPTTRRRGMQTGPLRSEDLQSPRPGRGSSDRVPLGRLSGTPADDSRPDDHQGDQARRMFSPLENSCGAPTASAPPVASAGEYSWMTVAETLSALSKASSTKASWGSPSTSRRASNTETAISGRGSSWATCARIWSSSAPGSFHMPFCSSSM
ncbi:hypothetical protein ACFFX0_08585 [Citricoccus parietis]|uniref:Uncharacterized protein n=1 Tax=Citricoccus parietis TaxID=592307 RepID=A0ABV5FYD9_9MICC